jgi:hypothetical protein
LLRKKTAPVYGIIKKGKLADAFDFQADDSLYGGGSYIIPYEFVSPRDSLTIKSWENQRGVDQQTENRSYIRYYLYNNEIYQCT